MKFLIIVAPAFLLSCSIPKPPEDSISVGVIGVRTTFHGLKHINYKKTHDSFKDNLIVKHMGKDENSESYIYCLANYKIRSKIVDDCRSLYEFSVKKCFIGNDIVYCTAADNLANAYQNKLLSKYIKNNFLEKNKNKKLLAANEKLLDSENYSSLNFDVHFNAGVSHSSEEGTRGVYGLGFTIGGMTKEAQEKQKEAEEKSTKEIEKIFEKMKKSTTNNVSPKCKPNDTRCSSTLPLSSIDI